MRGRGVFPLLVACAGTAHAQTVRGIVVDRGSVPVPGAVVQLMDAANAVVARSLTNDHGEYRVVANAPGRHRLRTLRIGFRPTTSEPIVLVVGGVLTKQLTLTGVAFSLDTVRVVRRNSCRVPSDSAAASFAVWEQARTALTAATLTTHSRSVTARIVQFERLMDPDLRRIEYENARAHGGHSSRAWKALPADSLRRIGYVTTDRDGATVYFGPDLEVLLSEVFVEDHCFHLVDDKSRTRIGIAFEPTRARASIAEIRGTLWLDRKSAELRHVEFRYTNISRAQEDGRAGGDIEFARLSNGAWLITRWQIRMPVITRRIMNSGIGGARATIDESYVTAVRVAGGELSLVARGQDTLWAHPPLAITGVLTDAASREPVTEAIVTLRATQLSAVTDSTGRFRISSVLPGAYTLEVRATPSGDPIVTRFVTLVDSDVEENIKVAWPGRIPVGHLR